MNSQVSQDFVLHEKIVPTKLHHWLGKIAPKAFCAIIALLYESVNNLK